MTKTTLSWPLMNKHWCRLWTIRVLLVSAALFLLAALAGHFFPRQILTVDRGPVTADVMVVLGGGFHERALRAAELFKAGESPQILVSGAGDNEFNEQLLETNGVPASAITLEGRSRSTRQNAEFSIPLLRKMGAHRVIIVTSWYHSRRALACFKHYGSDLNFYSRPAYTSFLPDAYQRAHEDSFERAEYFKLVGYWVCYGVSPF